MVARTHVFENPSPMLWLLAQRDHAHTDAVLLERELAIHRSQRQRRPAKRRPHFAPQERCEILQLKRLRGWSTKETAQRFVVHPNTIRNWQRAVREKHRAERLVGQPPWNRLHAGVRWLVHEIRRLYPERDFGTRTIARYIMRAGIQISRASVRRILEEDAPPRAKNRSSKRVSDSSRAAPDHFFNPPNTHHVWHLDLTTFRMLWRQFQVAAIIDGFSRKIVGLRVFKRAPLTDDLVRLVDDAVRDNTVPRFLVTDHGGQFQKRFRAAMNERGIEHARGRAGTWQFNAKVERLFWSLKRWWRLSLVTLRIDSIQQRRLDAYRAWYNFRRPHTANGTLTPIEISLGRRPNEVTRFTEGGDLQPEIRIERRHVGGDRRLLYPVIGVTIQDRFAA